jgi:hypothetical protein
MPRGCWGGNGTMTGAIGAGTDGGTAFGSCRGDTGTAHGVVGPAASGGSATGGGAGSRSGWCGFETMFGATCTGAGGGTETRGCWDNSWVVFGGAGAVVDGGAAICGCWGCTWARLRTSRPVSFPPASCVCTPMRCDQGPHTDSSTGAMRPYWGSVWARVVCTIPPGYTPGCRNRGSWGIPPACGVPCLPGTCCTRRTRRSWFGLRTAGSKRQQYDQ